MSELFENLWVEKHRPKNLDEMVLSKENRAHFSKLSNDNFQHHLLVDSSGKGKTTMARILAKSILDCEFLYINASDENGVDTIRTKIKGFIETASFMGKLKLVILDECDGMSREGQDALRNMMETFSGNARFVLTANNPTKVRDALWSRCGVVIDNFDFSTEDVELRMDQILKLEKVTYKPADLHKVVETYFPDIRKTIEVLRNLVEETTDGRVLNPDTKQESNEIPEAVAKLLSKKAPVEKIRAWVIKNQSQFGSYGELMVNLQKAFYQSLTKPDEIAVMRKITVLINDYIGKDANHLDKELNFYVLLIEIDNLIK